MMFLVGDPLSAGEMRILVANIDICIIQLYVQMLLSQSFNLSYEDLNHYKSWIRPNFQHVHMYDRQGYSFTGQWWAAELTTQV